VLSWRVILCGWYQSSGILFQCKRVENVRYVLCDLEKSRGIKDMRLFVYAHLEMVVSEVGM
jgi:hypothetical protein